MHNLIFRLVVASYFCLPGAVGASEIRVAAAASLYYALPELANVFQTRTGHTIKLTFGSSGNLVRQILQGAPFDVFFSANVSYAQRLVDKHLTEGEGAVYALGRLVLYVPTGSTLLPSADLSSLSASDDVFQNKRIAIANPEHAPYGAAAREALQSAGIWAAVKPRLVIGENAAQATQFGVSGSVDAAIIPLSTALLPNISQRGRYAVISDRLYTPLNQVVVLIKGADSAAREFYESVATPEARSIIEHYGFGLPKKRPRRPDTGNE